MKITCSACHASYNLPDEKVAGRRVKVRCKRCSEPIVVDGSQLASIPPPPDFEDEATRVMASPAGENPPMWTVNLSDTEQGDMTDEEIVAGWQAGVVTEDAYVWREGMDDWRPILDVPELVSLLSQATEAEPPPAQMPEPQVAPAPTPSPAKVVPQPAAVKAPLGAGFGASPLTAPKVPSPPKAQVLPRNDDMFGARKPKREKPKYEASEARNENSMLFSLDALKAAARETSSDAPPKSVRVDEDMLLMGGGPDLFTAPLIQIDPTPPPPQQSAFKPQVSRGPAPAVSPTAMDFPEPQKKGGKGWLIAVAALLVVGGGAFYGYTNFLAPQAATASTDAVVVPSAAPEPTQAASAAPEETAAPTASAEEVASAETTPDAPRTNRGSQTGGGHAPATPPAGDKPPSGDTPPSGDKPADAPADKPEAPSGGAPFNTDAAKAALSSAASNAASCKSSDGPTGSGKVQVTFAPSGRVTSANVVAGPFGGTSVGGCIARTFRQARVPAFSGDPQTVSKSFSIPD